MAFANTDGGTVYIGIEDDGTVCGVANPDETVRRVTDMMRNSIRPDLTPFFRCAVETLSLGGLVSGLSYNDLELGLSMPSAAQLIRDMVLHGLLVKTGDGRYARYVLPNR